MKSSGNEHANRTGILLHYIRRTTYLISRNILPMGLSETSYTSRRLQEISYKMETGSPHIMLSVILWLSLSVEQRSSLAVPEKDGQTMQRI